jgi:hypothetical protein
MRKDKILCSFLSHEILASNYKLDKELLPKTVHDALISDIPIVKAIALIVDNLEGPNSVTDSGLRNIINQYLNEAAI